MFSLLIFTSPLVFLHTTGMTHLRIMIMAIWKLPFSEILSMTTVCTSRRIGLCLKPSTFVDIIRATPSKKKIIRNSVNFARIVKFSKTALKFEERENQHDATIGCLLSTSVSTCLGHHYAHLQENKDRVLLHMVYCAVTSGKK